MGSNASPRGQSSFLYTFLSRTQWNPAASRVRRTLTSLRPPHNWPLLGHPLPVDGSRMDAKDLRDADHSSAYIPGCLWTPPRPAPSWSDPTHPLETFRYHNRIGFSRSFGAIGITIIEHVFHFVMSSPFVPFRRRAHGSAVIAHDACPGDIQSDPQVGRSNNRGRSRS